MSDIKYHQNQGTTVPAEQVHLHVLPTSLYSQVLHLEHVATQKSYHFTYRVKHRSDSPLCNPQMYKYQVAIIKERLRGYCQADVHSSAPPCSRGLILRRCMSIL